MLTRDANIMQITVNDVSINAIVCIKYLGAHLDQYLTTMANSVIKNVNQYLKYLYRKAEFQHLCVMMCNALIQPVLDYSSNFWYRYLGRLLDPNSRSPQTKLLGL